MIGTAVSRYRILSKLGGGGMGVVYEAVDTQLGRHVAIKFLPAGTASSHDALERFQREARAASALDHPHICTVFDVGSHEGQPFLVMERLKGQTLKHVITSQGMPIDDVVRLGEQFADALDAAHRAEIVHRDLKPANLFVTERGDGKILDFGLAKVGTTASSSAIDAAAPTVAGEFLTEAGTTLGTVAYMSPEQAKGRVVDARSDLFSLGVVLYEIATGRLPFPGESTAEHFAAILGKEPTPPRELNPEIPARLEEVILKALEKHRALRYQSAADLRSDLARLARDRERAPAAAPADRPPARAARRPLAVAGALGALALAAGVLFWTGRPDRADPLDSIAVLPFANTSGDPETEYLSDGITESLINSLSSLGRIRVVSRSTVFRYKGRDVDPETVGRELNVRAIVVGRVVQRGDLLLVGAELVDVVERAQLWGEQYNRQVADMLAVQTDLTREISRSLRLQLTGEEEQQLTRTYPQNTEAYQLYLRGLYHRQKNTEDSFNESLRFFQEAVEEDPTYPLAYAGLADTYNSLGYLRILAPGDVWPKSKAAATTAMKLDDSLAEAHAALGASLLFGDWDLEGAKAALDRAIALDPAYAIAHHWYAHYWLALGRPDEVMAASRRAVELDPLDLMLNSHLLFMGALLAGGADQFPDDVRRVRQIEPDFWAAHTTMGMFSVREGRLDEGLAALERGAAESGEMPLALSQLGIGYAIAGRRRDAEEVIARLEAKPYAPSLYIAQIHRRLGNRDEVLRWWEQAYEERASEFTAIRNVSESWASEPRVQDLLRRAGLSP